MKTLSILTAMALCLCLTACGEKTPDTPKDYAAIIASVQSPQDSENYGIISDKTGAEGESILAMLSIEPESIDTFSAAASFINTNAYFIGIFMPLSDKEGEVQAALEAHVELTAKSMENYLPEQEEIAKRTIVKKMKSGEIIIVMCESEGSVADKIKDALK